MADIRTLDYAAEYEFKETYGIRFHETKLKLASSESVQQNATVGESDDRIIRRDDRGDAMIVMGEDYRPQPFSSSSSYEKFGVRDYHFGTCNADVLGGVQM